MEYRVSGLQEILKFINSLKGGEVVDLEDLVEKNSRALASTLLSEVFVKSHKLASTYFSLLRRSSLIASKLYLLNTNEFKDVVELLAHVIAGLAINRGGKCVFVRSRIDVVDERGRVKLLRGGISCLPIMDALFLAVKGLVEILLIGRLTITGEKG